MEIRRLWKARQEGGKIYVCLVRQKIHVSLNECSKIIISRFLLLYKQYINVNVRGSAKINFSFSVLSLKFATY